MIEPLTYEFQMTAEFCHRAVDSLRQVLWMQNERYYHYLEGRMRFRSKLRRIGIVLGCFGLVLVAFGWSLAPQRKAFYGWMFVIYVAILAALFGGSVLRRALRRVAFRTVSWTAGRTMRRAAARAPYAISYELSDARLSARVDKLGISRALDLRTIAVAIVTPDFICVFRRPYAQTPERILYVPGPREYAALEAALRMTGAELLELPGA